MTKNKNLIVNRKKIPLSSLFGFLPKSYAKFLFFCWYFLVALLILAIQVFPKLDQCSGGFFGCWGPVSDFLIITNLPGIFLLVSTGMFSGNQSFDGLGLFSLLIIVPLFFFAITPTALLLLFIGTIIDSKLK